MIRPRFRHTGRPCCLILLCLLLLLVGSSEEFLGLSGWSEGEMKQECVPLPGLSCGEQAFAPRPGFEQKDGEPHAGCKGARGKDGEPDGCSEIAQDAENG